MTDIVTAIPTVRDSLVSILRLQTIKAASVKKGKAKPAKFGAALAGSAFCVVDDKYLVTAHHILNNGKPRNAGDRFYAFVVPGNGSSVYHFPITSFPLERPDLDVAVLEIGACATKGVTLPAIPVSFAARSDGDRVLTVGFPAPEIASLNVDANGNYLGGHFFLMSHANEGIISAQYPAGTGHLYELNVGWHHGESGGPIVALDDAPTVFSIMQHYRNIKSPHGVVAGPHRGIALSIIQSDLKALGVIAVS